MANEQQIVLPLGTIRFAGTSRCWDDYGRNAFEVSLEGMLPLYGEWKAVFAENEVDFTVNIVSYGYRNETNLANPYPDARQRLSENQVIAVERLISALLSNQEILATTRPFSSKKASYDGKYSFDTGWVIKY